MAIKKREELEAADTILVKDVPWKEEQESAGKWLHKGDLVHARLELQHAVNEDEIPALVTEFTVTGLNGARVFGSPHYPDGMSQHDGWRFELLRTHEVLPDKVSEIKATMRSGVEVTLMGKGVTWVDSDTGKGIDVNDIVSFVTL